MMPASRNRSRHAGYSPEHQGIHDLQGIRPDREVQEVRGYLGDQVDPETSIFMLYLRIAGHIKMHTNMSSTSLFHSKENISAKHA